MERIFKAYLRKLLRDLIDLETSLTHKDYENADRLLQDLIMDTIADIENVDSFDNEVFKE